MNNIAAVSITKHGTELVRKLHTHMPEIDVYYMKKFAKGDEEEKGFTLFEGSVKHQFPDMFKRYDGMIMVISLGAVIRMISPLLVDKKTDPAVVVIDDKGEFAISVISGHLGGANALTKKVAETLQATPVITTASDVQQTIPVDIFGKSFGWVPEDFTHVVEASAAVVNEEPVIIVQESGETDWWAYDKPLPSNLKVIHDWDEVKNTNANAALVITHRHLSEKEKQMLPTATIVYRPKVIHLGIGCNRGTSAEEIENAILTTLEKLSLSPLSVKAIASIDLKKDEEGLLQVCEKYEWDFRYYAPEKLNTMPIKNPSDVVYKYTGAYGVSEPAAMISSGNEELLLEKEKSGNVTISIAIERHE